MKDKIKHYIVKFRQFLYDSNEIIKDTITVIFGLAGIGMETATTGDLLKGASATAAGKFKPEDIGKATIDIDVVTKRLAEKIEEAKQKEGKNKDEGDRDESDEIK